MKPVTATQRLTRLLKLAIVVGLVAYLLTSGRLSTSDLEMGTSGFVAIGIGVTLIVGTYVAGFLRHWILARAIGIPLTFAAAFRVGAIGTFFNSMLLGGVGGDVVKIAYLVRLGATRAAVTASIFADRVLGLIGLLMVSALALLFLGGPVAHDAGFRELANGVAVLVGGATVCGLVAFVALLRGRYPALLTWFATAGPAGWYLWEGANELVRGLLVLGLGLVPVAVIALLPSCRPGGKVRRRIESVGRIGVSAGRLIDGILRYQSHPRALAIGLVLSFGIQAVTVLSLFVLALGVAPDPQPGLTAVLLAGPPALVTNSLPLPGGGLGVGEVAFDQVLGLVRGDTVARGAAVFLAFRLTGILAGLLGLPWFLAEHDAVKNHIREEMGDPRREVDPDHALRPAA